MDGNLLSPEESLSRVSDEVAANCLGHLFQESVDAGD